MAQQKVELRKVRDFSDNLNDTFQFLKLNYKPLLTYVVSIAGVFLLTAAILNGIYQGDSANILEAILSGNVEQQNSIEVFTGMYFLVILFMWLTSTALQVVVVAYMKVYEEKNGETPLFEEVWNEFKSHFLPVALYQVPLFILMFIGLLFCFAPGIYLAVVFAPFVPIIIMERQSFSGAFNRCFTIIRDNFWLSLGIYFVIFLISWFSSGIISLIVGIITGLITYFTTESIASTVGIVTSVLNVLGFIFYIIMFVSVVMNYYNLIERYEGTGILRRLDGLGTDTPQTGHHTHRDEEY
jgi:hypothetical protein